MSPFNEFFFENQKGCLNYAPNEIEGCLIKRHRALMELAGLCEEKSQRTKFLNYYLLSLNFHFDGQCCHFLRNRIEREDIDVEIGDLKETVFKVLTEKALLDGCQEVFEEFVNKEILQFANDQDSYEGIDGEPVFGHLSFEKEVEKKFAE